MRYLTTLVLFTTLVAPIAPVSAQEVGEAVAVPISAPAEQTLVCSDYYSPNNITTLFSAFPASVAPNESVVFTGQISNAHPYPLVDVNLHVKVFKRNEVSVIGGYGDILVEQTVVQEGVAVPTEGTTVASYEWVVPANAEGGDYYAVFFVTGAGNDFPIMGYTPYDDAIRGQVDFVVIHNDFTPVVSFDRTTVSLNGESYRLQEPPRFAPRVPVEISVTVVNPTNETKVIPIQWNTHTYRTAVAEQLVASQTELIFLQPNERRVVTTTVEPSADGVVYVTGTLQDETAKQILNITVAREGFATQAVQIPFASISALPLRANEPVALFACLSQMVDVAPQNITDVIMTLTDASGEIIHRYQYNGQLSSTDQSFGEVFTPTQDYRVATLAIEVQHYGDPVLTSSVTYDCNAEGLQGCPDTSMTDNEESQTGLPLMIISFAILGLLLLAIIGLVLKKKKPKNTSGIPPPSSSTLLNSLILCLIVFGFTAFTPTADAQSCTPAPVTSWDCYASDLVEGPYAPSSEYACVPAGGSYGHCFTIWGGYFQFEYQTHANRPTIPAGYSACVNYCPATPPAATGNVSAVGCTIPNGANTCNGTVSWSTANAASPNVRNNTTGTQYSTAPSGSMSALLRYGQNTLQVRNNTTVLGSTNINVGCASGTSWNGSTCAAAAPPPPPPPFCTWIYESNPSIYPYGSITSCNSVMTSCSSLGVVAEGIVTEPLHPQYCYLQCPAFQPVVGATGFVLRQFCGATLPPPPPPPPVQQPAIGNFEGTNASNCSVSGWAFDPDNSTVSIAVHVYRDGPAGSGTFVTSCTANGARPDVNTAHGISGQHGFNCTLPASFSTLGNRNLFIHAIDTNGGANNVINGSPRALNCTPPPSGNISVATCSIPAGANSCFGQATWTITNAPSPNVRNETTGVQFSTSANGSNVGVTLVQGINLLYARNGATNLGNAVVTASCVGGTFWNGSQCALPPATATISGSGCTIASGASTCSGNLTWNIQNAGSPNVVNVTTGATYSTAASGNNVSVTIRNGGNTIQARNGATMHAQTSLTGTCASGTSWNGSVCAAPVPGPTCSTPAISYNAASYGGNFNTAQSQCINSGYTSIIALSAEELIAVDGMSKPNGTCFAFQRDTFGNVVNYYYGQVPSCSVTPPPPYPSPGGDSCVTNQVVNAAGTGCGINGDYVPFLNACTEGCGGGCGVYDMFDILVCFLPFSVSGPTATISGTGCTVAAGASTCSAQLTWNIQNATVPNVRNTTTNTQYSTSPSATNAPVVIRHGANTILARNNTSMIEQTTLTGTCASGSSWNGVTCAPAVVACQVGAEISMGDFDGWVDVRNSPLCRSIDNISPIYGGTGLVRNLAPCESGLVAGGISNRGTCLSRIEFWPPTGPAWRCETFGYACSPTPLPPPVPPAVNNFSGAGCTIPAGASTCDGTVTWSTTGLTAPNVRNTTTGLEVSTNASGAGISVPLNQGNNTIALRDGVTTQRTTSLSATCTTETSWNGTSCATPITPEVDLLVNGTAGPVTVNVGGSFTLSWTGTAVTGCALYGGGLFNVPASPMPGSRTINVTSTAMGGTYSILCNGDYRDQVQVVVRTLPTVNLQASVNGAAPAGAIEPVNPTDTVRLVWDSDNADTCTSPDFDTGGAIENTAGVVITLPPPGPPFTFTILCTGAGGTEEDSLSITTRDYPNLTRPTIRIEQIGEADMATGNYNVLVSFGTTNMGGSPTVVPVPWQLDFDRGRDGIYDEPTRNGTFPPMAVGPAGDNTNRQISNVPFGHMRARVIIDPEPPINGVILESDETDNIREFDDFLPPPAPPMTLTPSPNQIVRAGQGVTLTWVVGATYPMECVVEGPGLTSVRFNPAEDGPSGSVPTGPITAQSNYTLTCVEHLITNTVFGPEETIIEVVGTVEEI